MDVALGWRPAPEWRLTAQSLNTVELDRDEGAMASGIETAKGQLSIVRDLGKSVSLQVGGWQVLSGEADQPLGFDAVVWLRY
jgi:hypothetical protein